MIRYILGIVLKVEGLFMLLPCLVAVIYRGKERFFICRSHSHVHGSRVSIKPQKAIQYRILRQRRFSLCLFKLGLSECVRSTAFLS